ncbi:hypothetical protein GCM10009534_01960 [Kribbella sandramycini]|uniref:Uncharacterized protein n=1 Tax=Kribbella sandramycini TaxID=60450 RepID=A0A841SAP9_9ACTN|nr:hypothetical protein [Kribbella sandramycini]
MRTTPRRHYRDTVRLGSTVPGAVAAAPPSSTASGAMTAALVIVPADPMPARSHSAHQGRAGIGSRVGAQEVPSGAPWMVRLSTGRGDATSAARLAPGQDAPLGPRR